MSLGPFVLPFRGDQYGFAINYKSGPEEAANFDLACVAFGAPGGCRMHTFTKWHAGRAARQCGGRLRALNG